MIGVFAGKGGVGKTTCASAAALHHSSLGERTLAISTDPTPSLSNIFGIEGGARPARVQNSLWIDELGLPQIKQMWENKFGKEVYEVFSSFVSIEYSEFLDFMVSLLPGLAEEFMVYYIREMVHHGDFETVIWDTAPLGQTLALLQTPAMLLEHLRVAPRIYSKLKRGQRNKEPLLEIIKRWREMSEENLGFLRNEVSFSLVTIPETLAVRQLESVFVELHKFDFKVDQLIINNVIKDPDSPFLVTKSIDQKRHIEFIRKKFGDVRIVELPLFPYEVAGLQRIREVERILFGVALQTP